MIFKNNLLQIKTNATSPKQRDLTQLWRFCVDPQIKRETWIAYAPWFLFALVIHLGFMHQINVWIHPEKRIIRPDWTQSIRVSLVEPQPKPSIQPQQPTISTQTSASPKKEQAKPQQKTKPKPKAATQTAQAFNDVNQLDSFKPTHSSPVANALLDANPLQTRQEIAPTSEIETPSLIETASNNDQTQESNEASTKKENAQTQASEIKKSENQQTEEIQATQTNQSAHSSHKIITPKTLSSNHANWIAPKPIRLKYRLEGSHKSLNYHASAEILWNVEDDLRYNLRATVSAFLIGSRTQISEGEIGTSGLQPKRFSDKNRSELAAHFRYDLGKITFSANTPDAHLLQGAQDRLSFFIQMASMVAAKPELYTIDTRVQLPIVSSKESAIWEFVVVGTEELNLPSGKLEALKFKRLPRNEFDNQIEFWLAPNLNYLPARIRFTQKNGDFVDQRWIASEKP